MLAVGRMQQPQMENLIFGRSGALQQASRRILGITVIDIWLVRFFVHAQSVPDPPSRTGATHEQRSNHTRMGLWPYCSPRPCRTTCSMLVSLHNSSHSLGRRTIWKFLNCTGGPRYPLEVHVHALFEKRPLQHIITALVFRIWAGVLS